MAHMDLTLIAAGWVACALLGAIVGSAKQSSGAGFVLGLLFGPLGVIAAFAMDGRRQCPACAARLNQGARKCAACGAVLPEGFFASPRGSSGLQMQTDDDVRTEAEIAERLRTKRGLAPRT